MAYPFTPKLIFPLVRYRVNSYKFKQADCFYDGKNWGIHLGEDCNKKPGTPVMATGRGRVVYSAIHAGKKEKRNWGNVIILAHKNPRKRIVFFSLYAHLGRRLVSKGTGVELGDIIGLVGKSNSPQNGWWEDSHLHFAIYTGQWKRKILPGYYNKNSKRRTRLSEWKNPSKWIKNYS